MLDLSKNLILDFSEEVNIFVDIDNHNQLFSSQQNYQINNRLNCSLNHIKRYSFQLLKSERLTIKFCLENNVLLVAIPANYYRLFEKINKLRHEQNLPYFLTLIRPDFFGSYGKFNWKKTAIIGGTFHAFHKGHKEYIELAFQFADRVNLLVTSDEMAKICKPYKVKSFNDRKEQLHDFLIKNNYFDRCNIKEINSEHEIIDVCLNNDISLSVVIPEYYPLFERINRLRECQGLSGLLILVKQRTLNNNGFDINSTIEDRFITDENVSPLKAIWEN
ncbi:MAG: adenylyltransferase/cytidyltransferase family protein [Candidatus Hodarchaeota archaeon]